MSRTLAVSLYTKGQFESIRVTLVDTYAEVYAREAASDLFFSLERFEERLISHASAPGWRCAIGEVDGETVGYAYGAPLAASTRWWRGLTTPVDDELIREDGRRTLGLFEIMLRTPWRGQGIAHTIHNELVESGPEERVSLCVERAHPRVRVLYESWGYRQIGELLPFPDAPLYDAMILDRRPLPFRQ
ncbi:GNAT family N-acetyltransferase [Allostreptomyces psammosilenae]|uniref:GNAT superfamily N-acetyltransferase n=1 Tax=Allostreptomyces psammosilenae TaxID=1892865 RepID=A0A853AAX6_9ACTN|nr:GNAT family N-acetyltransferase [Allostreptomyces psammosilenae]NYI07658.1 GNAT superfamily N-acetyltransferase [Allostreptomyces psammosilenae]